MKSIDMRYQDNIYNNNYNYRRNSKDRQLSKLEKIIKTCINRKVIFNVPHILILCAGLIIGFVIGFLIVSIAYKNLQKQQKAEMKFADKSGDGGFLRIPALNNIPTYNSTDDISLANELFEKINVLCWVKTYPGNENQVKSIRETWGKRCNKLLFFSSEANKELGVIGLPVAEGRENLWKKVRLAYQYIYDYYLDSADWFLKTDDDTYIIMENLRYLLSAYSSEHPYYLGCRLRANLTPSFMSGGAGYVLSKKALKLLVEEALPYSARCNHNPVDDVSIATCLQSVNVTFCDTRDIDIMPRERFHPFAVQHHLFPPGIDSNWYLQMKYYPSIEGLGNLGKMPISFHYVDRQNKNVYDYLLYEARPFGKYHLPVQLPTKVKPTLLKKN